MRGTGFKVKVGADNTEVSVGEGEVEVITKKDDRILRKQLLANFSVRKSSTISSIK